MTTSARRASRPSLRRARVARLRPRGRAAPARERRPAVLPENVLLEGQGSREVHFDPSQRRGQVHPVGARVEAGREVHDEVGSGAHRLLDEAVEEHRAGDERPRGLLEERHRGGDRFAALAREPAANGSRNAASGRSVSRARKMATQSAVSETFADERAARPVHVASSASGGDTTASERRHFDGDGRPCSGSERGSAQTTESGGSPVPPAVRRRRARRRDASARGGTGAAGRPVARPPADVARRSRRRYPAASTASSRRRGELSGATGALEDSRRKRCRRE